WTDHRQAPAALPRGPGAVRPELCRPWDQLLSLYRSRQPHHRGGRRPGLLAAVHAGGRADAGTRDPGLYRLRLLGLPRKDRSRRRLSLMQRSRLGQWAWFAALWCGGVLSVVAVGLLIRLFLAVD